MDSTKFKEIEKIYQAALKISPEKRSAFLEETCGEDFELRKEVESLLSFDTPSDEIISQTPDSLAAEMFSAKQNHTDFKGKEIDQYEIISQIGKGGMGTVYLAKDKSLGRPIAIKFLDKKFSQAQDRLQRFILEARTASALNQPNIITIYEIGKIDNHHFIATEFIEGKTLREIIEDQPLKLVSVVEIAIQIASALKAAHDAGIIHRDIKPDNIMVRPDGLVKVLDFGVAKLSEQEFEDGISIRIETKQGMIIGTVDYMSPEQAGGEKVDTLTDIFSFGVVLYYMLAGKLPFEGGSPSKIITSILMEEPKPLEEFDENIPTEIKRIVEKALEKEKTKRFQTANEMLEKLKQFKKHLELSEEIGKSVQSGTFNKSPADVIIESIAVLPFVNESENKDVEYLTDGLTENLINNLSQIPGLLVKSTNAVFRYKGNKMSAKNIGEELNVQAVLIGRVTQRGEDLALNLELVNANNETALWGEKYNSNMADLMSLQRDITRNVSDKLRPRLNPEEKGKLTRDYTTNTEAYQAYLKGRFHWKKREGDNIKKGIEYFQKAIELDPNFALAWSGLADSYAVSYAYSDVSLKEVAFQAKNAAKKAVEIDPELSEAQTSYANVLATFDWDFNQAERHFQKAIELNPNYVTVYQWYAKLLGQLGRHDEAIKIAEQAIEIEPYSWLSNFLLGLQYLHTKRFDKALDQFQKTYDLEPDNDLWNLEIAMVFIETGKADEAIERINKVIAAAGSCVYYLRFLASAYVALGKEEEARKILKEALELEDKKSDENTHIAVIYARLGEKDEAFEYLNEGFKNKEPEFLYFRVELAFENLRDDPQFKELLRKTEEVGRSNRSGILRNSPAGITNDTTTDELQKYETAENTANFAIKRNSYARKVLGFITGFLLLAVIGFSYWYYANDSSQIESIAVLPFINESGNADVEYLTDGMTENLINNLSQIPALSVKSTNTVFRYKGKNLSAKEIGEELNVQAVLIGKVIQRGEDLAINLELVDTNNETVLWGEKYNSKMNNLMSLQRDITRNVSNNLRPRLNTEEKGKLAKEYTTNTEAYQAYLRGRFYWKKREEENLKKGIEYFQKAIELDPNFALAWSGLADSYAVIYVYSDVSLKEVAFQAKNAAKKAVEIDPELSEAHTSYANVLASFDWEFKEAEKHFQKAIELNTNYATAYEWYAQILGQMGRHDEAIKIAKQAIELEPYSTMANYLLGLQYLHTERFDEALDQFQKTYDLEPENISWKIEIAMALTEMGKTDKAIEYIDEVIAKQGREAYFLRFLASAYIAAGKEKEAQSILRELLELNVDDLAEEYDLAIVYARLGEKDKALEYLNKSFEKKELEFNFLKVELAFENLRDDPRFKELLRKTGLPE